MFLRLWQYSQENTCVGVSFLIKLQAFSIPPENIKKPLDFLMLSGGMDKGLQSTFTFSGRVIVSWQVLTFKPPDLSLSSVLLDMTSDSSFFYVSLEKRRTLFKPFIESHLSIVHWYGCFTKDRQTIKLTVFMSV